ncbi:MAG: ATP-binding cassette domain-containing protein [Candidatus Caenarcaniphilales bacterium]|nr:ATP-binding cassette domain-containing protein [Candidatus Caenarcaniphilales bacterium]
MQISLNNISKKLSESFAIADLNLLIEKEKTTVLIGPSGSGKSTVLRLIIGLVNPDKGEIKFGDLSSNEEVLSKNNLQNLRRQIGYVAQGGGLFPHLTAEENIVLAAKEFRFSKEYIFQRLQELLSLTNLRKDLMSNYPHQLSGGQIQRVSIMRALILEPKLILFDEPLVGLDPGTESNLREDLKTIFANLKKTVLLITHDMSAAEFLGDTIIFMSKGQIIDRKIEGHPNWDSLINASKDVGKKETTKDV